MEFLKYLKVKTLNVFAIVNNELYEKELADLSDYHVKCNVDLAWMLNGSIILIFLSTN